MSTEEPVLTVHHRGVDNVPELRGASDTNSRKGPVLPVCELTELFRLALIPFHSGFGLSTV